MEPLVQEGKHFKRVKTPTVVQMEATECGAAALSIVLNYFGKHLPLERLRLDCGIGRDGSKAYNMVKAAERYHLHSESFQVEEVKDMRHLKPPCILHWEFNHFVVFEGIDSRWVYINDPGSGPKRLSWQEFGNKFTGVVMAFAPTPEFKKSKVSLQSWLQAIFMRHLSLYAFLTFVSLFLVIPGLVIPGLSKIFVDDIFIQATGHWLPALILGLILTALCRSMLQYIQQITLLKFTLKFIVEHSYQLLWKLLHTPLLFFYQRFVGDVCYRNQAFFRIGSLMTTQLSGALMNSLVAVFYGLLICVYAWQLGIMVLTSMIFMGLLLKFVRRRMQDASLQSLQLSGALSGIETFSVQNVEMIKAQNEEGRFFLQWSSRHAELLDHQQKLMAATQWSTLMLNTIMALVNTLILVVGAWLIMQGSLTAGLLVAIQSLTQSMFGPLTTLFQLGQEVEKVKGDVRRVEDISHYKGRKTGKESFGDTPGTLTLDRVSFKYSPFETPAVKDIHVSLSQGQTLALVGPSGSGKSTLAKVFMGLLSPQQGRVLYKDQDLREYDMEGLKYHIGYVDQDVMLLEGTLRDNLVLWKKDVEEQALLEVLEAVSLMELLNQKGGLDFYIQEGGRNLSQGQKQRIEIARALLYKPALLVLDEATASLDANIERLLLQRLKDLKLGLLMVTHRLQAIENSDCIYVLEEGRLIGQGQHAQLMESCELYQRMVQHES